MAIRYSRVRKSDGVITNQWTDDFAGADYREPGFGDPSTYDIVSEDITAQESAKKAAESARLSAQAKIKALDAGSLTTLPALREAIADILIALGLK